MIKIEKADVFGWESAIRGMRNPLNSWEKSDSQLICVQCEEYGDDGCKFEYIIGPNDLSLMKKLVSAGSDHSKFMRMINVTADVTAPLYWWKEYDTYKVGTVANSCSTMHKIHAKEFTVDDFSIEHLNVGNHLIFERVIISALNDARNEYLHNNDKVEWWQMIQLLPTSYNQKRTIQLNYAVLRNIYHARKNHKLDEWHTFCDFIKTLPYSELITE